MAVDAATADGQLSEPTTHSDADEVQDDNGDDTAAVDDAESQRATSRKPRSPRMLAGVLGAVLIAVLAGVSGYLGYQAYRSHQEQHQRELFVQGARQAALNLTTIDWQSADADVQRILDSSTGTFYDDFSNRSQPFIEVVRQTQSKSVGTISEAGLESSSGEEAQVLVAVTVNISNAAGLEQDPRGWRMRITMQKVGNEAKVSNVAFVP
jgi:Mce-associated membrane protein